MVNLPMGIDVISQAIDILVKEKGMGSWRWLLEGRTLVWEGVPVNGVAKVNAYVFGGKRRKKNTVFVRQGFWKFYAIETALKVVNKSLVGRTLARLE